MINFFWKPLCLVSFQLFHPRYEIYTILWARSTGSQLSFSWYVMVGQNYATLNPRQGTSHPSILFSINNNNGNLQLTQLSLHTSHSSWLEQVENSSDQFGLVECTWYKWSMSYFCILISSTRELVACTIQH